MRRIKHVSVLLGMLMMFAMPLKADASGEAKGLFVIVTSGEAQTQMMAMMLSSKTIEQKKSVQVLLCGPAGELALKNSEQVMFKPLDKSPQMLLKNLISKGVVVEVCPLFLPNSEATKADLVDGVTVAKPPVVAKKLREEGIKLLTY